MKDLNVSKRTDPISDEKNDSEIWNGLGSSGTPWDLLGARVFLKKELIRSVRFERDVTYIGRMPENHVVLDDPQASRSHARVIFQDGKFLIQDQESENGIFVNGKKVQEQLLAVGDTVKIGDHVLEIIPAATDVKPAIREEQIDEAGDETWRNDQTVSLTNEELAARRAQLSQPKPKPPTGGKGKALPTMSFRLQVGSAIYEETITFEKGRRRDPEKGTQNELQLRVKIGQWILEKKLPL